MKTDKIKSIEKTQKAPEQSFPVRVLARQHGIDHSQSACDDAMATKMAGNLAVQRLLRSRAIQAKLSVSQPSDPYEQEADQVSERITNMPDLGAQPVTQRVMISNEEKGEQKSDMAKASLVAEQDVANGILPHAEEAISVASDSSGQPLPSNLQRKFEQALGSDLSTVRLHTGSRSIEANKAISALAYTTGGDIHFNEGQYNPQSSEGQRLLAHEVVHTVQQTVGNQAVQRLPVQRAPTKTLPVTTVVGRSPGELDAEEQAFFNLATEAIQAVITAEGYYSSWLSSLTIPYSLGWSAHQKALQSADAAAKDANDIALGTVLAFVPGGLGGLVGTSMKKLSTSDFLVDAVRDLSKYGLRKGGEALGGGAPSGTPSGTAGGGEGAPVSGGQGFNAMPADPLVWQNFVKKRAEDEVLNPVKATILNWQNLVNNHDPYMNLNFDPVAAVKNSLKLWSGISLFNLKEVPQQDLTKSYERGFLVDWINDVAPGVFIHLSQFAGGKARDKIVKYGKSIGLEDVDTRLSTAVSMAIEDNNERARKSGHGLI
jgi:hypothetical protein